MNKNVILLFYFIYSWSNSNNPLCSCWWKWQMFQIFPLESPAPSGIWLRLREEWMGIRFSAHLPLLKMFPSSPQIKVFIQTSLLKLKRRIGALFYPLIDFSCSLLHALKLTYQLASLLFFRYASVYLFPSERWSLFSWIDALWIDPP